jgi:hypothetical protein
MRNMRRVYQILFEKSEGKRLLEDTDINLMMVMMMMMLIEIITMTIIIKKLKEIELNVLSGFIWLRIGSIDKLL